MNNLQLALIGNGSIGHLVNAAGEIVWGCYPRFDGDALFCALLNDADSESASGIWAVDLLDVQSIEQHYMPNTAVLVTCMRDSLGGIVEITDFAPRFYQYGRLFCPITVVRRIRRIAGSPRVRVRLRLAADWGSSRMQV